MEFRPLGKTGLNISSLGFGCASYWGMPFYSEKEAASLVHYGIDQGINFFDTGHSYSLGNAEPRLGRILKNISPSKSRDLIISTKAGTRNGKGTKVFSDYRPSWIRKSVELSLRQLGLETIPILHLHRPILSDLKDELFDVLVNLKSSGMVQVLSINSFDDEIIDAIPKYPAIECLMLDYNFLKQYRETQIEILTNAGVAIIGGAALANHVYVHPVKKLRGLRDLWYLLRILKNSQHKAALKKAEESFSWLHHVEGITSNQIAIAFSLSNPLISSAIFGTTRMNHLQENLCALDIKLPQEIMNRIRAVDN